MDKDFQDRIDEYLLRGNKMSEEDKAQFLKEIEEDAEKKAQYEFTKNVKEAFVSRGDKLKAMAEFQKEYETRDDMRIKACSCSEYIEAVDRRIVEAEHKKIVGNKSNFRKKLVWFSSIAAVLVVGFFAAQNIDFGKSPSDYEIIDESYRGDDVIFTPDKKENRNEEFDRSNGECSSSNPDSKDSIRTDTVPLSKSKQSKK